MIRRRTILQWLFLAALAAALASALFTLKDYEPYPNAEYTEDNGFIALSYFGIERDGSASLIAVDRLAEHLSALKSLGYVTITQKDIVEYYKNGRKLPPKALFLMFEDGRRDTAVFAQKLLEGLNFKATAMTYPEKFAKKDTKFLQPDDLKTLEKSTYWEMGTNGYRLFFINVFDRYDNYIGEIDPLRYAMVAPYLGSRYNHFLMDYVRDEQGFPKESYLMMKQRIENDYERLEEVYKKELGYVPQAHVLMHSNTGAFGNNTSVSAVNEKWIKNLFAMNFNREGYAKNVAASSIYDLTRIQPQPYWYTNHLLMRLKYDDNDINDFVTGDEKKAAEWDNEKGAAEFKEQTIVLTSLPKEEGIISLKGGNLKNISLTAELMGNKLGMQKIYLRADKARQQYLSVAINNNVLQVNQKSASGNEKNIFWLSLDELDEIAPLSTAEDKKAAELRTLEAFTRYAENSEQAKDYTMRLKEKQTEKAPTVADGAPRYEKPLSLNESGDRKINILLEGEKLTIDIDGKRAVTDLAVEERAGGVMLAAAWGGWGWSQRHIADDVYDGVFKDLKIEEIMADGTKREAFSSELVGWQGAYYQAKLAWHALINWFIKYL
jgi:hypothetical protein